VHDPAGQPGVKPLAWLQDDLSYSAIINEHAGDGCYTLWAFYGSPATMTADGQNLFINMIHTQCPIFADGFENLLSDWSVVAP
jgi:hypothetical protein